LLLAARPDRKGTLAALTGGPNAMRRPKPDQVDDKNLG
jgi:hypothetical protein